MSVIKMTDLDLRGKRVLIREDFNVPVQDGKITSDLRIQAALPNIRHAIQQGACVMLMSHLGRPDEGVYDESLSLQPIATHLSTLLGQPVPLIKDWAGGVSVGEGEVVLFENVRFAKGEKKNKDELAQQLAKLCDIYVMDAFGTAHRAEASTHGVAKFAPVACAGILLAAELDALSKALEKPQRPLVAIVGGSKVSTKLTVLESLSKQVDQLIVGGGIANTFIAAAGYSIGKSLCEVDLIPEAQRLIAAAKARGADIPIPTDVVVSKVFSPDAVGTLKSVDAVAEDELILDIGTDTAARLAALLQTAGTVVWNGPLGVFEYPAFRAGTETIARAIASSSAFSIAGGGDTLAAVDLFGVEKDISYISTGGGAFLEFLEGKVLPAVEVLTARAPV